LGLLATLSGGTTTYYHQDNLSVRLTTDANGNVLTQQATFPFGEQWYQSGSGNKFVFTSYDRDSESGLDYAMARYYYSSTGTFIMPDPVAGTPSDPQSWNRYPYGRNIRSTSRTPAERVGGRNCWSESG
jgi:RHS repeat-associated protein